MTASRLLAKLEDFRLLPFLVAFAMVVGILVGKALAISDFTLTPRSTPSKPSPEARSSSQRQTRSRSASPSGCCDDVPGDDERSAW